MRLDNRLVLMTALIAPVLMLGACLALVGGCKSAPAVAAIRLPKGDPGAQPQPAEGGTRGPSALLFTADGSRLYVAEEDENDVAVLDPEHGTVIDHLPSGGAQPTALALSRDGKTLVIANTFSGTVGIVDGASRTVRSTVDLPGEPRGVAVTSSDVAYISVGQLDQVIEIHLKTAAVIRRIPVGHCPQSLLLAPNGAFLYCLNRTGGSLSIIDIDSNREVARLALPATNLRGMALTPDGSRLCVAGMQAHNDRPTEQPEAIWSNVLLVLRLSGATGSVERVVTLDAPDRGAADPCGVALDSAGETAYVTLSGSHEVAKVPLHVSKSNESGPTVPERVHVGANPRGIAIRPGGRELWIGNHLGSTLSVIANSKPTGLAGNGESSLRQVELGPATPSPNRRLKGRYLFTSAHVVRGGHFSCDSCHPDGGTDGLSWRLSHVKEPPELRNTRDLRGSLLLTGPYGWTSREDDFEVFVEDEVSGLLKTRLLRHPEVHALWDLVNETPLPRNPYRAADGALTESARRGETLFNGTAGCAGCHVGDMRGGTRRKEWVGTTPSGQLLDVPHLVGAYESAPYLHDGRAATLEDIFNKYNPARRHGKADALTPAQLADVLEYVREL